MSVVNSKDNKDEVPKGIKWEWDENKKCLTFKASLQLNDKIDTKNKTKGGKIDLRSGAPRLVIQNRQKHELTRSDQRKALNSTVTISDIKNAALNMLSERYFIPSDFELYCNAPESKEVLDKFLLQLVNYFYWYFESIDAEKITNEMCIERSQFEKERIEKAQVMLKRTLKSLGKCYSMMILGSGSVNFHHMLGGHKRVSSGFRDRGLFETLYPFCMFFVWITFKRRDYDTIRKEIGRILRSDSFNCIIKFETLLDEENMVKDKVRNKENILNKYEKNKQFMHEFTAKLPSQKTSLSNIEKRSPALVCLLPSAQENSQWLFSRISDDPKVLRSLITSESSEDETEIEFFNEVGIIGQPMKLFHAKTLAYRVNGDEAGGENKAENDEHNNGGSTNEDQEDQSLTSASTDNL